TSPRFVRLRCGRVSYRRDPGKCRRQDHRVESEGPLRLCERPVRLWSPVSVELPYVTHFQDLVEVEVGHHDLILVPRGLCDALAARIAEVALAVELADVPRLLMADPIDGPDEVAVGHGVGGLL